MLSPSTLPTALRIWAAVRTLYLFPPVTYLVFLGPSWTVAVTESPAAWAPWSSQTITLTRSCSPPVRQSPRLGLHFPCTSVTTGERVLGARVDQVIKLTIQELQRMLDPLHLQREVSSSLGQFSTIHNARQGRREPAHHELIVTRGRVAYLSAVLTGCRVVGCTSCGWFWWPAGWSIRDGQTSSTCSNTPHTRPRSAFEPEEAQSRNLCEPTRVEQTDHGCGDLVTLLAWMRWKFFP